MIKKDLLYKASVAYASELVKGSFYIAYRLKSKYDRIVKNCGK